MRRAVNILFVKFLFAPTEPVKVDNANLMGQDSVALKNEAQQKSCYYGHVALESKA